MSIRATIVLALLLAILCAAYWALTRREIETVRRTIEARRLADFTAENVCRITVRPADGPTVAAERDAAGAWRITEPLGGIPADQARWNGLAANMAALLSARIIDEAPADLARFGLDAPTLIVGAETADAARLSVAFGKMEPIQVNRYARVNDGAVVLISDRSFLRLNRSLRDLRDRRIFSFAPDAVRRIEFARLWDGRGEAPAAFRHSRESGNPANEAPGETPPLGTELGRVAVVRNTAEGPWQVVEPVEAPADQDRVAALLQELPNLTGDHYVDQPEDLSDYGLNPGWARLTLAGDGDAAETLYLGAADLAGDGGLFAKRADQESVCLLDPYFVNFLPLTRTHFRDARLITRPVRGLNALRYVSREDEFILQKDPDLGWRLVSPPADQTDQVAVSTLIGELVRMTALDFPVGAPEDFGLNDPDVALWLGFEGESDMVQIGFVGGPEGRDACFATQDTGAVVLLPEEALAAIQRSSDDLESFELMRFSKEHAVKLAIAIEARQVVIENRAGVWQVALPADHVLQNQSDARLLLDALSPLKAEADLVVPEDLAVYGLDRPVLTVTVEVILPEQPGYVAALGPLFVGAPAHEQPRTRYAMLSGRDGIYLIGQDVLDRVREALRGVRPAPR